MSENKELKLEELDKVSGGVLIGDHRIFKCLACNNEYDPDTTSRGEDIVIPNENGNGQSVYATWFCPVCQKYERYTVVQLKQEDLIQSSIFSI